MHKSSGDFDEPPTPTARRRVDTSTRAVTDQLLGALARISDGLPLEETLTHVLEAATGLTGARRGVLEVSGHRLVVDRGEQTSRHDTPQHTEQDATAEAEQDTAQDTEQDTPPGRPAGMGPRSRKVPLLVPVTVSGLVVGHLHLHGREGPSAFTEHDGRIASALAGVAGLAVENAELLEQQAHRDQWSSAPSDLLTATSDDDAAYQRLVDWARDASGADLAWVVATSGPADLTLRAVSGFEASAEAMADLHFNTTLARCAAAAPRTPTTAVVEDHPCARVVAEAFGLTSLGAGMVVPISNSRGIEAVVVVAWRSDDPGDDLGAGSSAVLANLASRAPLVMRTARDELAEQRRAVLQDRVRIARDLHDLVVQRLFALSLDLQATSPLDDPAETERRLARASAEIDATIRDLRGTIFRLDASSTDTDPRAAIVHLVERATRTMKMRPSLEFRGPVRSLIDPDLLPDVLAVLSEALSNAVRHARATQCSVAVILGREAVVRVTDDGTGFPETAAESGLANIRRRAEHRGGRLSIASTPAGGTCLEWAVPLI